jgi:23S rRNA G2445 N2-methylase RlmL
VGDRTTRPILAERVRDPGFTPSLRDIDPLVDLLTDDDVGRYAERAIGRLDPLAIGRLGARLRDAPPRLRAKIVKAIGRFADRAPAVSLLVVALRDEDDKTRRNAAIALGHARGKAVEEALLRAWAEDPRPEMRRSIAASLGKVGSVASTATLRDAALASDPQLVRIAQRASIMIERTASRSVRPRIDATRAPEQPIEVVVCARRGLEDLLAEELSGRAGIVGIRTRDRGRVSVLLSGPLSSLFVARTMLSFRFPLATEWVRDGETVSQTVARAATSEAANAIFATWSLGTPRYRIAWAEGGHKRAITWEVARAIGSRAPHLVNDPTASAWELIVETDRRFVNVAIAPRSLEDPRFTWRRAEVPAASHPTIAAALAWVAGARAEDVVWDPFLGSGAELVERALLGPYRALFGSDLDERALAAARANLSSAGLEATLEQADALEHRPPGVTLVITNPPMGRRSARAAGLAAMLDRFVVHAAAALSTGGRLVWVAPWPRRARSAAAGAGLSLESARIVDMGGFDAELQAWVKGAARSAERSGASRGSR